MTGGGTKLPRSSPHSSSSHSQAASPTSVLRPGRILTWWALTRSSSSPRSSSTYQQGFQYWPVASMTTWVTPSAARARHAHTRHHLVFAHVQRCGTLHQQLHRHHLLSAGPGPPGSLVVPGGANRGNDAETRARSKQFVVPGRPPRQSRLRALLHQAKPSLAGRTILIRRDGQRPWDLVWLSARPQRPPGVGGD